MGWVCGLDKGREIKGLVICYVVLMKSMIYGTGLWTSASCMGLVLAQVLQHPIDKYRYISHTYIIIYKYKKTKLLNKQNKLEILKKA